MNIHFIRSIVVTFAFATIFAGSVHSQETKTMRIVRQPVTREFNPAFKGTPMQEIESREHELADALRLNDATKLEGLLSDSVLVAGVIADKKQFIAYLKTVNTKYHSIEKSGLRIQLYGDTAVATGIQKADIEIEGGSRSSQTIFMNTWKRVDGTWRCIGFAN